MPSSFLLENAPVVLALVISNGCVLDAVQLRSLRYNTDRSSIDSLRETVVGQNRIALVPESASIDSLATAVGVQALCKECGVVGRIAAEGEVTGEDNEVFCNIFDVDLTVIGEKGEGLPDCDAAIAIGGAVPRLSNNPPVVGVVRHRPTAEENILAITRMDDGATSTAVTDLVRDAGLVPDQRGGDGASVRRSRRDAGVPSRQRPQRLRRCRIPARLRRPRANRGVAVTGR